MSTADRPGEVHVWRHGTETQISDATRSFADAVHPIAPDQLTAGENEIDVWVFTPPGFDPTAPQAYPMLVNIHGGPFTQYGNHFFDEAQVQAAAGYVVMLSNPRGGSGRDTAWGRAITGPKSVEMPGTGWGSVDAEDVETALDTVLERYPAVDPARIGVIGGSYGGYLVTWLIGHTNRFAAACSERAVNNMATMEWTSDIASTFRTELGVTHLDDPAEYARMSPITYVRDINTPVLIVHSEDDLRCPISQAEELFVALRLLGREVEFVRFPGENHELSRSGSPVHRRQRFEIQLEFFARHLHPGDMS
jgi:dipeptidyl aminopeptidase/acylaminoacyl peptidase